MVTQKRLDYIDWDFYFMGIAFMCALRSKDPSTRNGAVIVDPKTKHVISCGYNGMPNGKDDVYTWAREGTPNKYDFVIHAEENAILNTTQTLKDCMMYLYSEKLYLPCKGCMRLIIQSGIKEIIVNGMPSKNTIQTYNWEQSLYMIQNEGIEIGILNDPIGLFKKIKDKSDKAIIMYENVVDKGKIPENSYLPKKSESDIKADIKDINCFGFDISEEDIKKADEGMIRMGFKKKES